MSSKQLEPATDLDEVFSTLSPEPLIDPVEFKAFYRADVNAVRGEDTVARIARKLQRAYKGAPLKTFLMGHPGVGKSTELTRLLTDVKDQYIGVRLSIEKELNPATFKIFDVLLLIMAGVAEEAQKYKAIPAELTSIQRVLAEIQQFFRSEEAKQTTTRTTGAEVEAGTGAKDGSLWGSLLGLFASVKLSARYSGERKTVVTEHQLKNVSELVETCNRLLDMCSESLLKKTHRELLVIVEDLDKTPVSPQQLHELFLQYGSVFQALRVSMLFTIPVWLAYSPGAERLPLELAMIHDTPVFNNKHESHSAGRDAVLNVLKARVSAKLFAGDQMEKLVVASGGNLRDLFFMISDAAERAGLRSPHSKTIEAVDAQASIAKMRREYRMKLGQSPYDGAEQIPYSEKSKRLVEVYNRAPDHDVPDKILYSLLRGRAIQEFNGVGWFGVHPLVVDILKEQEHLKPQDPGGTN